MFKIINIKKNVKKIVFFVIIFTLIFLFLYYKNLIFGNNKIKNRSEKSIIKILSNIQNYDSEIEVNITSNKTQNSYLIHQIVKNEYSMQEILSGDGIKGTKIEINQGKLKISNSTLNLEKIYENYNDLLNNSLFLNTFAKEYEDEKNSVNCYENNGELILEIELTYNTNTYIKYKKLYINAKNLLPTKLEIKDINKKETISIIYNNIEVN